MDILKRTPRTEMRYETMIRTLGEVWQGIARSEDEDPRVIDFAMTQFARLSSRVMFENGDADFELAVPQDDTEAIGKKFLKFLDADWSIVSEAERRLRAMDAPSSPVTAPEGLPEDAEKN